MSRWSIPYGSESTAPFWGPKTSAVNFCEDDYIITRFVGEFFNTLTSLIYIGYGFYGLQRYKRQAVSLFAPVNFPYWGLIGVGVFSGLYHATLKYHTQMADELSMHMAMGTVVNQVFNFQQPPSIQRRNTAILLGILVPFYIYHCMADEFAVHVLLFLAMCITVSIKTTQIIGSRITNPAHKRKLTVLSRVGTACAIGGYALWNVDVHCCSYLTAWKRHVGLPWGAVFELHGWWHLLTAISAYIFMALIEFLTSPEEYESHGMGFAWPAKAVLEGIVSPGSGLANGHANGHVARKPEQ